MNGLHLKRHRIHNIAIQCKHCKCMYEIHFDDEDKNYNYVCPECNNLNYYKKEEIEESDPNLNTDEKILLGICAILFIIILLM